MNGWMPAGNRSDEKKTPERSHIGSMTRFISPLTVSVVLARLATSRPMPAKARAPSTSTSDHQQQAAPDRHAEGQRPEQEQHRQVGDQEGQPRAEDGQQEVAPGHRRGDEALQQLADPEVHQQEADAPEAAAHRVQRRSGRGSGSRCSVSRARSRARRAVATRVRPPGGLLEDVVDRCRAAAASGRVGS